ncbi:MAG TPA: hypothetical protein VF711_05025 [Acidimicrobiales bacterium]|jgi:hypothetical protein
MRRVVAYVPDLMDRSKVAAAGDVTFVTEPSRLGADTEGADIVIVDLTRAGVLDAVPSISAPVIGFANHTQKELLEAARDAGCAEALPRSAFFARLRALIGES